MSDRLGPPEVDVAHLVDYRRVLVCAGSGGVGKTTTAAALAAEGAHRGRRAVVMTIDPARRLANALGLASLTNEPTEVAGPWPGSLHALMLDATATFDALVREHAHDATQANRILANRFYRNISRGMSGTQEYMAGEKLYQLYESDRFDLIVVDTPPTRSALDFLDAPNQLLRLLDHRVYRALMAPGRGFGRVVNRAAHGVVRAAGRVVGSEVVDDVISFFAAFEGMEDGFRHRSSLVEGVLSSEATGFVLVASPRPDTVEETAFFTSRLADRQLAVRALIVNRVHPRFADLVPDHAAGPPSGQDGAGGAPPAAGGERASEAIAALVANLADFEAVSAREEITVAALADVVAPAPVVRVPLLDDDIHDLAGLARLRPYLTGDVGAAGRAAE